MQVSIYYSLASIIPIMNKHVNIKRYKANKSAKTGETIHCPTCGKTFVKQAYNQIFCSNGKTKKVRNCKDMFWNNKDENKRNNVTRISPASKAWLDSKHNIDYDDHIFSSEGLGQ